MHAALGAHLGERRRHVLTHNCPSRHIQDMSIFSRAPAEAMVSTVAHLRDRYGGHEAYLDTIGFTQSWRDRLRSQLADAQ